MNSKHPRRPAARGFSLIMAIFLVVVLGGIAVLMGKVLTLQSGTETLDEESAFAYQAARAGGEWSALRIQRDAAYACATSCTLSACDAPAAASSSDTVNLGDQLAAYSVRVDCQCRAYCEGDRGLANPLRIFHITATASKGTPDTPVYVSRQVRLLVEK